MVLSVELSGAERVGEEVCESLRFFFVSGETAAAQSGAFFKALIFIKCMYWL